MSPVSSINRIDPSQATRQPQAQQTQKSQQAQTKTPQDTVHLSKAALAASGDADHDGDSK